MHGSCLCGEVAFEIAPPLRDVVACHCTQCRKTSGHYWAATSVPLDRLTWLGYRTLAWYRSSGTARRGFCRVCGASLFWQPDGEARMAIAAGCLDGPTGLRTDRHIFVADAGSYYTPEGAPPPPVAVAGRIAASCLCGAVRFTLPRPEGEVTACHCTQCRKLSGHYSASFDVDESGVQFLSRMALNHHATPGGGRRGFCVTCGSSLYFRAADGAFSVEAGAVDGPVGVTLGSHVFVADKGDYYDIRDDLPRHAGWS